MARCIPENPSFVSPAEQTVYRALLRLLDDEALLSANLRFTDERGDHELDLVVAIPDAGIAVIEVKGGQVWYEDGYWWQSGAPPRRIRPVEQAMRGKYALGRYLADDTRWDRRRVRMAHLVAFPQTRVSEGFAITDLPRWLVLDRDDVGGDPVELVRDALLRRETHTPGCTTADVDALATCLQGRGLPQRDVLVKTAVREHSVDLITEGQAVVLSAMATLSRVEVRGGAGTGKTWLALEQAGG